MYYQTSLLPKILFVFQTQSNKATLSKQGFFKHKLKKLLIVDLSYNQKNQLSFDLNQKLQEFDHTILWIKDELDKYNYCQHLNVTSFLRIQ